jgi:hypothetical protein
MLPQPIQGVNNSPVGAALEATLGQPSPACGTPYDTVSQRDFFTS